jgi:hypothetical protein
VDADDREHGPQDEVRARSAREDQRQPLGLLGGSGRIERREDRRGFAFWHDAHDANAT